jgi:hypothetical protein
MMEVAEADTGPSLEDPTTHFGKSGAIFWPFLPLLIKRTDRPDYLGPRVVPWLTHTSVQILKFLISLYFLNDCK